MFGATYLRATLLLSVGLLSMGCQTKAGTGALIGGAGGAAIGGLIGSTSHGRAGEGALIGGLLGAGAGALIGHGMDKADQRQPQDPPVQTARDTRPVTREDIVAWSSRGVKDDIIIDRIERSGTVFRLTAAEENQLRDQGISEEVVRAMRDTARR